MRVLLAGLSNDTVELHLAQALTQAGVHLTVIALPNSKAAFLCPAWNIPTHVMPFRHRWDRSAIRAYRELLHRSDFDVIHCLTNRALSTALWAARRFPRPVPIVAYRGTIGHLSRWDPASRLSYLHPRVNGIICVSEAVRTYLIGMGIPEQKLFVIWKGHDPAWYTSASRDRLREFGIPDSATVVAFSGNIRPVKGVSYLLRAFKEIEPGEGIHLLVMGENRQRGLRARLKENPIVHFAGYQSDAAALCGACDIFVAPSVKREGLPKALLEAMAQAVPPIVTAVGGMVEAVVDQESGLVVPPRDARALREAIRRLAGDAALRQRLGAAAKARVEGPFHFRHTVEKTLAVYEKLIGR